MRTPRLSPLILALWPVAGSAAVFGPAAEYELSGTDPTDIAVADLDGDGALDAAVAMWGLSSSDGKLSIHLNEGEGLLADHPAAVPFKPYGIAAGDWNRDGLADLAVTQGDDRGLVHLYLGTGGGAFAPSDTLTGAGAFPAAVVARDFNGDGVSDLAVAAAVGAGLTLFDGVGDGTFAAGRGVPDAVNWQDTDLAGADFNADGRIDLALPAGILAGAGDGTFTEAGVLGGSGAVEAVDVDGDGRPEVVVGTADGITLWRVLPGNGVEFLDAVAVTAPSGLAGGDIDGDGRAELFVTDRSAGTVRKIEWNGVGEIDITPIANCIEPGPVALADLNGDGSDDLLVACRGRGERAVLLALPHRPPGSAPAPTPVVGFVPGQYGVGEAEGSVTLTVERDTAEIDSRIAYATVAASAEGGLDYETGTGVVTFSAGVTRQTLRIPILDDALIEGDERFRVELTSVENAVLDVASAEVTIIDDDADAGSIVEILNPAVVAGEQDGSVQVIITRSGPGPLRLEYATADGTAVAGEDYVAVDGALEFTGGSEQRTITVDITDDARPESTESFMLNLSGAAIAGAGHAEITIIDDEQPPPGTPVVSVSEVVAPENSPAVSVRFHREGDTGQVLTLNYRTVDGLALAGEDYEAASGTVVFDAGQAETDVTVMLRDDAAPEGAESFLLRLTTSMGETVAEAVVTITDDDSPGTGAGGGGGGGCVLLPAAAVALFRRRADRRVEAR